jgi:hypothetical protein
MGAVTLLSNSNVSRISVRPQIRNAVHVRMCALHSIQIAVTWLMQTRIAELFRRTSGNSELPYKRSSVSGSVKRWSRSFGREDPELDYSELRTRLFSATMAGALIFTYSCL